METYWEVDTTSTPSSATASPPAPVAPPILAIEDGPVDSDDEAVGSVAADPYLSPRSPAAPAPSPAGSSDEVPVVNHYQREILQRLAAVRQGGDQK